MNAFLCLLLGHDYRKVNTFFTRRHGKRTKKIWYTAPRCRRCQHVKAKGKALSRLASMITDFLTHG